MVQYPKINTYVHTQKNSIPCQLGDDFVLSRPTMWMKKGNLSMVHSSRKKHIHVQKKLILVNWVVFFPFKPRNVDEKKRIIPWFTHPKENFIHAPNISIWCSQLLHGDFTCQVKQCGPKTQKIILWVHPFQGKHIHIPKLIKLL
jgi:hypothetical protein